MARARDMRPTSGLLSVGRSFACLLYTSGSDIYWLYDIQVLPEGVLASYEVVSATSDGLFAGAVLYDLETGETLEVIEE